MVGVEQAKLDLTKALILIGKYSEMRKGWGCQRKFKDLIIMANLESKLKKRKSYLEREG